MNLLIGALTIGLLLSLLALGVFITYRVFGILDLTADGAFGVGAATAAALLAHGWSPGPATALGAWAGMMAGLVTGLVHTRFGINALLAGILTTTALYSGNLYIMGGGDTSVAAVPTLITRAEGLFARVVPNADAITLLGTAVSARNLAALILLVLVVAVVVGCSRASSAPTSGSRSGRPATTRRWPARWASRSNGMIVVGLVMANGLIGLAGALFAEYQGFANIQMGLGMIVTGLASVIVGETLAGGRHGIAPRLVAVVVGAVLFRLIIAGALRAGSIRTRSSWCRRCSCSWRSWFPDAVRRRFRREPVPGVPVADPALEIRGLDHTFHSGSPDETRALQGIDLTVERGSFVILLGTNGSGKSTLLGAVAGSFTPTRARSASRKGHHRLAGAPPRDADRAGVPEPVQRHGAEHDGGGESRAGRSAHAAGGLGPALSRQRRPQIARADRAVGDGPRGPARHADGPALGRPAPGADAADGHDGVAAAPAAGRAHRGTRPQGRRTGAPHDAGDREPPAPDDADGDPLARQAARLGDRVLMMHRGRVVHDFSGIRKRRLRVDDLMALFDEVRGAELLDESTAAMLARSYV